MKILFFNSLYTPNLVGGAERSVQALTESVAKAGHQVVVVSTAPRKGVQTDRVNGVRVYYIGLKNLYWPYQGTSHSTVTKLLWHALDTYNPWMGREVSRVLDAERPNLVHTNNLSGFSTLIWQQVKQRGLPLVHTLRDYYLLCPRSSMFRNGENCKRVCTKCRPYALVRRRLTNHVDTVVGVSRFVLERHLETGYFATTPKRRVIYTGYRAGSLSSPSRDRSLPVRFGYLGRLVADKGIETLLESITQLPEGTWSLNIGGRGPAKYERYLRTKYEIPAIQFSGYIRPEVFFPKIDVLVVPSLWHEPFARTPIEAYGHGVPVIGSNRGGTPEFIEEGLTGFLFDPSSPEDLTAKMRRFINGPGMITNMQLACLRKAESILPQRTTEQYLEAYADSLEAVGC